MNAPSTAWKEDVAADEDQRFAQYATWIAEIQAARDQRYREKGRALHRKAHVAARGSFTVHDGLPPWAAHGLFAQPSTKPALVRLSNGGIDRQKDKVGDIRGFAIKVEGVDGDGALGGKARAQDFALINRASFGSAKSDEFVQMMRAVAKGPAALIGHFVKTFGLIGGLKRVKLLADTINQPFGGFAVTRFYSAAPIACGPYAARVRLLPAANDAGVKDDFAADFIGRLQKGPLSFALQLQPFVDEPRTPIEDASVDWPESVSPYVTVGQLTLPQQDLSGDAGAALAKEAEAGVFDPWNALAAHRPLGDVMRARKVVYFKSQQARGAG